MSVLEGVALRLMRENFLAGRITPGSHRYVSGYRDLSTKLGTLRSEDGDGRENVPEKVNSCSFNLHRDYSKSLTFSNVGEAS